jgi:hypothetical protein
MRVPGDNAGCDSDADIVNERNAPMDASRFDDLARALTAHPSRRHVVRSLAAAAMAQAVLVGPGMGSGEARKRKKKIKTNQFGCIDVGQKCYGKDAKCCSGICDGSGKRSRCAAHNQGTCARDDSSCPVSVPCGVSGNCYRTTGKAGFCGNPGLCDCGPCKKDKDCETKFGPGAACILCISNGDKSCVGIKGSQGTACVPPDPLN